MKNKDDFIDFIQRIAALYCRLPMYILATDVVYILL